MGLAQVRVRTRRARGIGEESEGLEGGAERTAEGAKHRDRCVERIGDEVGRLDGGCRGKWGGKGCRDGGGGGKLGGRGASGRGNGWNSGGRGIAKEWKRLNGGAEVI
eukprot:GFKZ01004631.1.p4 GENE.GFKZ01004631.1~~GFKZ01004631.1.p4  ORF type:complete len:107 (-),score=16.46 GFKZ01004631.1:916-1236(-)